MSAQWHEDSNAPSTDEMAEDERERELEYKRGFDAGITYQKQADPPPKAKQYRAEAIEARAALINLIAQVGAVVGKLARADGEGHLPCDREAAVVDACAELRAAITEAIL